MEEILLRAPIQDDINFIYSSWIESFHGSAQNADAPPFSVHRKVLDRLFQRAPLITIAAGRESPEVILGYIVSEPSPKYEIIHYIYVKQAFRNLGICKELITNLPFKISKRTFISHLTIRGKKIQKTYGLIYCPYFS